MEFAHQLQSMKTKAMMAAAVGQSNGRPPPRHDTSRILGDVREMEKHRKDLVLILERKRTEIAIGCCILYNCVVMIVETDATSGSDDDKAPYWTVISNYILLSIYTVEVSLRLYAYRCSFFQDGWNVLDVVVVGVDLSMFALEFAVGNMPNFAVLRAFRLVRLLRAFKALSMFPELKSLLGSFACALKAIVWGVILIVGVIAVWSILAVQLIHPLNREVAKGNKYSGCDRCPNAFATVFQASLTIFQTIVAGDSWGTLALPIIEMYPISIVFFLCVLVSVGIGIMNLILAVIVERSQGVKEETEMEMAKHREEEFTRAAQAFELFCASLDADDSGFLSKDELREGFQSQEMIDTMLTMNVQRRDLEALFDVLDENGENAVSYREFAHQLTRWRSPDLRQAISEITRLQQKVQKLSTYSHKEFFHAEKLIAQATVSVAETSEADKEFFDQAAHEAEVEREKVPTLTEQRHVDSEVKEAKAVHHHDHHEQILMRLYGISEEVMSAVRQLLQRSEALDYLLTNLDSILPTYLSRSGVVPTAMAFPPKEDNKGKYAFMSPDRVPPLLSDGIDGRSRAYVDGGFGMPTVSDGRGQLIAGAPPEPSLRASGSLLMPSCCTVGRT